MKFVKSGAQFFLGIMIIIFITGAIVLLAINGMVKQTLSPINQANEQMKTQVFSLLHPTPTIIPDPVTIIHEVQTLARLETIQYSVEKVITAGVGGGQLEFLFGDKLLFVAHGVVVAGVDLSKMKDSDLKIEDGTLHVTMPAAEVFSATLDNEKSYVFDRQTGLLAQQNVNLETEARKVAEQEIQRAALEDGIVDLAQQNAETFMRSLFNRLGYPSVIFDKPR